MWYLMWIVVKGYINIWLIWSCCSSDISSCVCWPPNHFDIKDFSLFALKFCFCTHFQSKETECAETLNSEKAAPDWWSESSKSADYSSAAKWPRIKLSTFKVGNLTVSLCCKVLTEWSCTDRRADLKHMLCLQKTVNMRSHEMSTEDVIFNLKSDLLQMDLQGPLQWKIRS